MFVIGGWECTLQSYYVEGFLEKKLLPQENLILHPPTSFPMHSEDIIL